MGRPGTNRDGTSRCPFVPGQKKILVPVSLCPGTRAEAKIPGQNELKKQSKKGPDFFVLEHHLPVLEHLFLS